MDFYIIWCFVTCIVYVIGNWKEWGKSWTVLRYCSAFPWKEWAVHNQILEQACLILSSSSSGFAIACKYKHISLICTDIQTEVTQVSVASAVNHYPDCIIVGSLILYVINTLKMVCFFFFCVVICLQNSYYLF